MLLSTQETQTVREIFKRDPLKGSIIEIEARFCEITGVSKKQFAPSITFEQYTRICAFFENTAYEKREKIGEVIESFDGKLRRVNGIFETKKVLKKLDITEYGVRISKSRETILLDAPKHGEPKYVCKRDRTVFNNKEAGVSIQVSHKIVNGVTLYDVELEADGCTIDIFLKYVGCIASIIDNAFRLVPNSEKKLVLETYKSLFNTTKFIGIQPVSTNQECPRLRDLVTLKLDGTRALLLVINKDTYLVSSKMEIRKYLASANVEAPVDGNIVLVFDGELLGNDYHIFDVIVPGASSIHERMEYAASIEFSGALVYTKEYYPNTPDNIDMLKAQEAPTDGLIYIKGAQDYYESAPLKWKSKITIDFSIVPVEPVESNDSDSHVYNVYVYGPENKMQLFLDGTVQLVSPEPLDTRLIVECLFEDGCFRFYKYRPDKTRPNFIKTAQSNWDLIPKPDYEKNVARFVNFMKRKLLALLVKHTIINSVLAFNIQDLAKYIDFGFSHITIVVQESQEEFGNRKKNAYMSKNTRKNLLIDISTSVPDVDVQVSVVCYWDIPDGLDVPKRHNCKRLRLPEPDSDEYAAFYREWSGLFPDNVILGMAKLLI